MRSFRRRLPVLALVSTLLVGAACGDDGSPGTPAASEPAPVTTPKRSTTTEALTPEEEVEAAYLRSWDVYAKALRNLDGSKYETVFGGEALEIRRGELRRLVEDNTPVRISVEHNYDVRVLENGQAVVVDVYRNHSVLLDAESGEPIEADPNTVLKREYVLEKVNGTWKVIRAVELP